MNEKQLIEVRDMIADFLKNRRIELGYSQQYLADKCAMSVGTINRMENKHFWLGMRQYVIICHSLKLTLSLTTMEEDNDIAGPLRKLNVK